MRELISAVLDAAPKTRVLRDEPLSGHTSFKIGGPAEIMLIPAKTRDAAKVLKIVAAHGASYHILGGGSNVLAPDGGVRGIVIKIECGGIELAGERIIRADAGCQKAAAAVFAKRAGLSGLEFMHGIPGTVGGGIYMNAGAYGGETSRVTESVEACGADGSKHTFRGEELAFSYRGSVFKKRPDLIILSAEFRLTSADPEIIGAAMEDLMSRRREKQPLGFPSAGSVFKRPEGYFAGKLIEDCGLKGYKIGGAQVSAKHAGFIINTGGATGEDVRRLILHISETVYKAFGVLLECEVEMW